MNYNEFKAEIIRQADLAGIAEYELFYTSGTSTTIKAFDGTVENYDDSTHVGICFRCRDGKAIGYSNTQRLCAEEAARLVKDAKASAAILDPNEHTMIFKGSEHYEALPECKEVPLNIDWLKNTALALEAKAKAADSRISSTPYAQAAYSQSECAIYNSFGLDLHRQGSRYIAVAYVILEDNGRKFTGSHNQIRRTPDEINVDEIVQKAVKEAQDFVSASKVKTGEYPVVFRRDMMSELLEVFSSIFSADSVQKGLSLLKDQEGKRIASEAVTITEDPFSPYSTIHANFDDEGVATSKKDIVKNGVLETLLYNLESASRAGKKSTGNGEKASYASSVDVGFTNLFIAPGKLSHDELLKKAGNGLYITELKGLHASADPTSGDFSLESKGYLIKDGALSNTAEQFTLAGNFFELLKNVSGVANDLEIGFSVGSPSVLVSKLSVSGEDSE